MTETLLLLVPLAAAALLAAISDYRLSARINVAASLLSFLCALVLLVDRPATGPYLLVDDLNVVFILLNTFVGFTTSAFSASYIGHELETGRLTTGYLRFYHAMYQLMLFGMTLALIANNIGLMWVAVELATLTTVVMVGIYRTHEAIEAAWKYFILGSVGIALALFGTILVYLAARPVVGEGTDAMVWTILITRARDFDPALLNIAFIFLLLGYGTKVGLAPMHAWLPDAHAEGPTPISAVLSGLLLNVALYALLRFKMLLAANPDAIAPGPLMIALGLISLIFAAFMLYRRRDIKRMFAYSSIEHMGITVFAFGMAGPLGNFAGLLQMTMHSLTKSAIFFSVGHVAQVKGTQRIAEMGGLTVTHPVLGWGLIAGVAAIAGLPPFGVFTSEFLVISSTFAREPLLALLFVFGLLVSFGALFLRVASVAFGEPVGPTGPVTASYVPMFAHLTLVLIAGVWLPAPLGRLVPARGGVVGMTLVDTAYWQEATRLVAAGEATLLGLWGEPGRVHMAVFDHGVVVLSLDCPGGSYPSVGALHAPAIRLERAARDLFVLDPIGLPDRRPWLGHGANPTAYPFLPVEGESLHQIPVGPVHAGIIEPGHFRFTADGETVVRLEQRLGYVHKGIDHLMHGATLEHAARLAGRTSGDSTVAYAFAFARAMERALGIEPPPRAVWLRGVMAEMERIANHLGDFGAICNDASFSLMLAHCGMLRERVLRCAADCFGHRLMMDCIVPGGVTVDLTDDAGIRALIDEIRARFPALVELYDKTASLQDRTVGTGILSVGTGTAVRCRRVCRPRLGPRFRRASVDRLSTI